MGEAGAPGAELTRMGESIPGESQRRARWLLMETGLQKHPTLSHPSKEAWGGG